MAKVHMMTEADAAELAGLNPLAPTYDELRAQRDELRAACKMALDEVVALIGDEVGEDGCSCNKTPPLCCACTLRKAIKKAGGAQP